VTVIQSRTGAIRAQVANILRTARVVYVLNTSAVESSMLWAEGVGSHELQAVGEARVTVGPTVIGGVAQGW